jgi:hypothetical protein
VEDGLVPQLGLPICHQDCLAYLIVVASASLPLLRGARVGVADCFLTYSVVFLFLHVLQLSYPSFLIANVVPLILSS